MIHLIKFLTLKCWILISYLNYFILFFSKCLLHTSCGILQMMPASPQLSSAPWLHCHADCAWFHGDCNHGCQSQTVRILRTPSSGPSDAVCSCSAQCLTSASTHHGLPANNPFKYKSIIMFTCFVMNFCFVLFLNSVKTDPCVLMSIPYSSIIRESVTPQTWYFLVMSTKKL